MVIWMFMGNPAGNMTAVVLDAVEPTLRSSIATRVLAQTRLEAEQVAFAVAPQMGGAGRIEMMGGEFCGNATRCYGLYLARKRGAHDPAELAVEISGCDRPLTVMVEPDAGRASCEMPLPLSVEEIVLNQAPCTLVRFEGIVHAVTHASPDLSLLNALEQRLSGSAEAMGVMFVAPSQRSMTAVVRVTAVGSTIWEKSCGSGSVATAVALTQKSTADRESLLLAQPGGTIEVILTREGGRLTGASIGGPVSLAQPEHVALV